MHTSEQEIALVFKALGDENRIRILKALHDGEKCACRLLEELSITQPTLSHHMKILCEAGIVTERKDGKWMRYTISCEGVCRVRNLMKTLLSSEHIPQPCRGGCSGE